MSDYRQATEPEGDRPAIFREAVRLGLRNRHFWQLFILGILIIYCLLFYYFRELAVLFRWDTFRLEFLYGAHDVQRLFFLVPIIYASYAFGIGGSILAILGTAIAILIRIMVVSNDTDPLWRIIVFIFASGAVGCLTVRLRALFLAKNRGHSSSYHSDTS